MKIRKIDIVIVLLVAATVAILLDHYRIHGYWFDTHDLLLQTESGRGYDSHEFFAMATMLTALILVAQRGLTKR